MWKNLASARTTDKSMERKRDGFVPIGDVVAGGELPDGRALTPVAPQARHHFTSLDQIYQLVGASEADADLGFMARLLALCNCASWNSGVLELKKKNPKPDKFPTCHRRVTFGLSSGKKPLLPT